MSTSPPERGMGAAVEIAAPDDTGGLVVEEVVCGKSYQSIPGQKCKSWSPPPGRWSKGGGVFHYV